MLPTKFISFIIFILIILLLSVEVIYNQNSKLCTPEYFSIHPVLFLDFVQALQYQRNSASKLYAIHLDITQQAWGMCWYDNIVNSGLKKLTISLGLPNQYSGAKPTKNDKFIVILHEFGHVLGLDHNKKESIMHAGYYPTSHHIFLLDFITVNIIYDLPTGSYYNNIEEEIRKLEEKYQPRQKENLKTKKIERKNIQESLCEIGNLNLYKMTLQNNIQVPNKYKKLMKNEQIKKYNTKKERD